MGLRPVVGLEVPAFRVLASKAREFLLRSIDAVFILRLHGEELPLHVVQLLFADRELLLSHLKLSSKLLDSKRNSTGVMSELLLSVGEALVLIGDLAFCLL